MHEYYVPILGTPAWPLPHLSRAWSSKWRLAPPRVPRPECPGAPGALHLVGLRLGAPLRVHVMHLPGCCSFRVDSPVPASLARLQPHPTSAGSSPIPCHLWLIKHLSLIFCAERSFHLLVFHGSSHWKSGNGAGSGLCLS